MRPTRDTRGNMDARVKPEVRGKLDTRGNMLVMSSARVSPNAPGKVSQKRVGASAHMEKKPNKPKGSISFSGGSAVIWARILFIVSVAVLLLFGLMMVYSASSIVALGETGDPAYYFIKQLQFVGLGVVLAVGLAFLNYRVLNGTVAWIFWGFVVALLVYTLISGYTGLGAKRWIEIAGFNFQPGEFAKLAILFICAHLITKLHEEGASTALLACAGAGVFVPVLLLMAQPDLGTAVIALIGVLIIMWLGGVPGRTILILIAVLAVLGGFAVAMEGFRQDRITAFLDPWASPLKDGYQIINSYFAFGEGGITGVGLGQSAQKYLYLPYAYNDFIFAIIGEELGLIGAFTTALFFLLFIFSGLMIARNAPDIHGRMLAGTATVLIGFQAFLNIFCVLGLVPITGKPLPFISAGGTSMLSSMLLVGIIFSVSFHSDTRSMAARRRDGLVIMDGGANRRGQRIKDLPTLESKGRLQPGLRSSAPLSLAGLSRNRTGLASQYRGQKRNTS